MAIRVLVADRSAWTRAALVPVLEAAGCTVCAEADDAPTAVEAALRERPDVCLLDMALGVKAAALIGAAVPDTSIVMLGDAPSDADLFAVVAAGASGYITRDTEPHALATALRRVRAGEAALSGMLVARLLRAVRRRHSLLVRGLTNRECEVLVLLCDGLRTGEIADRLVVERGTVRTHVASILRKLDVPDRAAAVRVLDER